MFQQLKSRFKEQFFQGHSRSVNVKKNILASFFIRGFSIGIGLILVPLTIHYVNPISYGIWLTLSGLISWLNYFDIGLGNGLRNELAASIAKGEKEFARIYVSTTYVVIAIIVIIVLALFFIINPFLNWASILNSPQGMKDELSILALIVAVFFGIRFILKLINTIIIADQKPAKASFLDLLGNFLSLIVIYILTKTTHGSLIWLGSTLSITPVLVLIIATWWFFSKDYKLYVPSLKHIKLKYLRNLTSIGAKFFIIQISALIIYETNNIIIAQMFGPADVTSYNIAFKYFSIITMIFTIIMTPFWSAITDAYALNDFQWIRNIIRKLQKVWIILVIIGIIMLFFSNYIYKIWIGTAVSIPFQLSFVVALYFMINMWCGIYSQFLNGVGKIKLQLYVALAGAIIDIPLSIFLGKMYGISGVILANVLLGIASAWVTPIQYYKIINNKAIGIWAK